MIKVTRLCPVFLKWLGWFYGDRVHNNIGKNRFKYKQHYSQSRTEIQWTPVYLKFSLITPRLACHASAFGKTLNFLDNYYFWRLGKAILLPSWSTVVLFANATTPDSYTQIDFWSYTLTLHPATYALNRRLTRLERFRCISTANGTRWIGLWNMKPISEVSTWYRS